MIKPSDEVVVAGFSGFGVDTRTGWAQPSAYIQWKGTDICMDFHCECGAFCHFDGDFAYTVKCPHCQMVWEMPTTVYPRKVCKETDEYWAINPKPLEPDEDFINDGGNPVPVIGHVIPATLIVEENS